MTLRRSAAIAAQVAVIGVVLWFASRSAFDNWPEVRSTAAGLTPHWGLLLLSSLIVMSAYCLLIEAWRRLMRDWGSEVRYSAAAHIWFVSVLGRYIPGRVWSAIAVGIMAKRAGVSPANAVGAALLLTLVNTVVGGSVLIAVGGPELVDETLRQGNIAVPPWVSLAVILAPLAIVLSLPFMIAPMAALIRRVTKRDFHPPRLSWWSILRSAFACTGAWLLYGVAFWVFYLGLFGETNGSLIAFVKVYTGSYLIGYVAVFVPGGLGAREFAMDKLLNFYRLSTPAEAFVSAWYSRLWLTVLEVLPGVALLLVRPVRKEEIPATGIETAPHPS